MTRVMLSGSAQVLVSKSALPMTIWESLSNDGGRSCAIRGARAAGILSVMRTSLLMIVPAVVMLLPGCQEPGRPSNGQALITSPNDWPFWPTQMRIHPLTRLVVDTETNRPMIEARIEFRDADNDPAKAVGELTVSLHAVRPAGAIGQGTDSDGFIANWRLDLRDLTLNNQHYDDVTRTYLLRMEVAAADLPQQGELRAVFDSVDGRQLVAARILQP